ncbi:hypothetical protein Pelo_16287 [Pelomyxa schiedti]|nr:hypothetical protein Pelo_16287 [Pelomyxa schiedti]
MASPATTTGANTTTTNQVRNQESEKRRIVGVSRVVWEQVLVPWVLAPARAALPWNQPLAPDVVSCLLRAGEALFPLVALCCRAAAPTHHKHREPSAHYRSIEDAAAALCPKCIAWIVRDKAKKRASARGDTEREMSRDPEEGEGERDRGREPERERGRAKEQVAVLTGLCRGGHLRAARAFVGTNNCECWVDVGVDVDVDVEVEGRATNNKVLLLWPSSSPSRGGVGSGTRMEPQAGTVVPSLLNWNHAAIRENEPVLAEEFWSERGVFKIMREVCVKGHLDVLKWILSSFFQIWQGNKIILIPLVHEASRSGHLDLLKWLVRTFDLIHFLESDRAAEYFKASDSVHDLKRFVESFPDWVVPGTFNSG